MFLDSLGGRGAERLSGQIVLVRFADSPQVACLNGGDPNSLRSNKGRLHPSSLRNSRQDKTAHPGALRPCPVTNESNYPVGDFARLQSTA